MDKGWERIEWGAYIEIEWRRFDLSIHHLSRLSNLNLYIVER